jgi:hypothetical protein
LDFIRRIAHLLNESHLIIYNQALEVLLAKFKDLCLRLEAVLEKKPDNNGSEVLNAKSVWFALQKTSIDHAIEELETWQRLTDPFWFLTLRIEDAEMERQLAQSNRLRYCIPSTQTIRDGLKQQEPAGVSIFRGEDEIRTAQMEAISFCDSRITQRVTSSKPVILDRVECPPEASSDTIERMTKDVRDLARKLRHNEPAIFGLLSCKGAVKHYDIHDRAAQQLTAFSLIFAYPEGLHRPISLRSMLLSGERLGSLSHRFQLAKDLAKAVSYVHTFGFVHKNIRPETVLTFTRNYADSGPLAFLVGFQNVRTAEGKTFRRADQDWEKNLYRHPRRRGAKPEVDYIMQHDVYSLGVCLLEIGLWQSFVEYDKDGKKPTPSSSVLGLALTSSEIQYQKGIEEHFVRIAKNELRQLMGTVYSEVVETCLTCLDKGCDFGDESEFIDADGILVGVRYIEKVRQQDKIRKAELTQSH